MFRENEAVDRPAFKKLELTAIEPLRSKLLSLKVTRYDADQRRALGWLQKNDVQQPATTSRLEKNLEYYEMLRVGIINKQKLTAAVAITAERVA